MSKSKEKMKEIVRMFSVEVDSVDGGWKEATSRWHSLRLDCTESLNVAWETWLVWHVQNGSREKLRAHLDRYTKWKATKEGKKPKWPVEAIPKELGKKIYREVTARCPELNARPRALALSCWAGDVKKHKANNGTLPGWVAILFNQQSVPTIRSAPIRYDKSNSELIPPADAKKGDFYIRARLDRIERPGKKTATSTVDMIRLRTRGRYFRSRLAMLWKMATGEWDMCGSSLAYSKSQRKWFCQIAFRRPKQPWAVDASGDKVAVLMPAGAHPWTLSIRSAKTLRLIGRRIWVGGRGHYVASLRQQIFERRGTLKANYRHAGSSSKGHGRMRATRSWHDAELSQSWRNFTTRFNRNTVHKVFEICREHDIGRIVYLQPEKAARKELTYLAEEGRHPKNSASWDFHQVATFLKDKADDHGLEIVVRKSRLPFEKRKKEKAA